MTLAASLHGGGAFLGLDFYRKKFHLNCSSLSVTRRFFIVALRDYFYDSPLLYEIIWEILGFVKVVCH